MTHSDTKRNFDKEAASWDDNPLKLKLADDIFQSLSQAIPLSSDMDVLDFGCGTGLLTFKLRPRVRSVTGVDTSQGMLDVFKKKALEQKVTGVAANFLDLETGGRLNGYYHLIASAMTMHHIKDLKSLMGQFYKALLPSGYLCLADLDQENGEFHDSNEGVFHQGFDREKFKTILKDAGFTDIHDSNAATLVKTGKDGIARSFSIFLMRGRKLASNSSKEKSIYI